MMTVLVCMRNIIDRKDGYIVNRQLCKEVFFFFFLPQISPRDDVFAETFIEYKENLAEINQQKLEIFLFIIGLTGITGKKSPDSTSLLADM